MSIMEGSSGRTKRGASFSKSRDRAICEGWLDVSQDPITGNSQSSQSFWGRILDTYVRNTGDHGRNESSLKQHWGVINRNCSKWNGCIARCESINPSGASLLDKDKLAREFYEQEEKKPFVFDHCWPVLQESVKWQRMMSLTSTKARNTTDVDTGDESATPNIILIADSEGTSGWSVESPRKRPVGQKAAKEEKKGKSLDFSRFVEESKEARKENWTARLEVEKMKAKAMEVEAEGVKMLGQAKLLKEQNALRKEEGDIMGKDLSTITDLAQKTYWQSRQNEIMSKRFGEQSTVGLFTQEMFRDVFED